MAFSPDGRFLLTSDSSTARLWDAPAPLPDDLPRLAAWVEAATGLELDERGSIRVLDRDAWLERRRRLEQLGGPPPPDPPPRLDPILFGAEPTARGDAWKERGLWDRAEAAYAEAIRARPLNSSVRDALAGLHVRARPARPGRGDARRGGPLDARRSAAPHAARPGSCCGRAIGPAGGGRIAALLDRFGGTIDARGRPSECRLGLRPGARARPPIRRCPSGWPRSASRLPGTPIQGRLLEHARGRAVPRRPVRRGDPPAGGSDPGPGRGESPEDWAFLAMAHHRLGHRDEARRWLDRLREHQPSTDPVGSGTSWRSACSGARPRP